MKSSSQWTGLADQHYVCRTCRAVSESLANKAVPRRRPLKIIRALPTASTKSLHSTSSNDWQNEATTAISAESANASICSGTSLPSFQRRSIRHIRFSDPSLAGVNNVKPSCAPMMLFSRSASTSVKAISSGQSRLSAPVLSLSLATRPRRVMSSRKTGFSISKTRSRAQTLPASRKNKGKDVIKQVGDAEENLLRASPSKRASSSKPGESREDSSPPIIRKTKSQVRNKAETGESSQDAARRVRQLAMLVESLDSLEKIDFSGKPTEYVQKTKSRQARIRLQIEKLQQAKRRLNKAQGKASAGKPSSSRTDMKKSIRLRPSELESKVYTLHAEDHVLQAIDAEQPIVPRLAHGLERVLFNPGVYHLQDPRSRVFNFDPYLQKIMPIADFNFNALKQYITSSEDLTLKKLADEQKKRYTGSTSSMTSALAHFHYLLSKWRPINTTMVSKDFPVESKQFTEITRAPTAIFLQWQNGSYAVDADKQFASANILSMLGKSLEKLLTLSVKDYERYRKSSMESVPEEEQRGPEAFHYSTMGDFLMRSQLDAHDPRIPGTGMFDLKTRAVISIRMDVQNYEHGLGYQIKGQLGAYESFEREYHDMIRAAFLKYSMQVRMGRMDGIFVAFHNVEQIFGFQYISLNEMDHAIHGQWDTNLGDQEFTLSLDLLNKIFDRATKRFPEQTIRLHFETRNVATPFMYIFAEPMSSEEVRKIQSSKNAKIQEFENKVLGIVPRDVSGSEPNWDSIEANVQEAIDRDELNLDDVDEQASRKTVETSEAKDAVEDHPSSADISEYEESLETNPDNGLVDASGNDVEAAAPGSLGDTSDSDETPDQELEDAVSTSSSLSSLEATEPSDNESMDDTGHQTLKDATLGQAIESAMKHNNSQETSTTDQVLDTSDTELQDPQKPLLAMVLTIRNKVNDKYIPRPESLSSTDKWSVEYSLTDIADSERAWSLYKACTKRRQTIFDRPAPPADAENVSKYVKKLRKMSQEGKNWRAAQKDLEMTSPSPVLRPFLETES